MPSPHRLAVLQLVIPGLAAGLFGCELSLTDGVRDPIVLSAGSAAGLEVRFQVVRAGGASGSIWGVGNHFPPDPNQEGGFQTGLGAFRGSLERGPSWTTDDLGMLRGSTGPRVLRRVALAAHPTADILYLAGGVTPPDPAPSLPRFVPGIQILRADATDPFAESVPVLVHPAATGDFEGGDLFRPHDPANFEENADQELVTVPLALAVAREGTRTRLVAMWPHGRAAGTAPPARPGFVLQYHRRAIAFFDLDASGALIDHCDAADGSEELRGAGTPIETIEPAWVIDLPEEAFSSRGAAPPQVFPGYSSSVSSSSYDADARFLSVSDGARGGGDGSSEDPDAEGRDRLRFLDDRVMPSAPILLLDEAHARGYLFANRWLEEDPRDGTGDPWRAALSSAEPGKAVLVAFSLRDPALGACNRAARPDARDPFADLFADPKDVGLASITLDPTAAVEPIILSRDLSLRSGSAFGQPSTTPEDTPIDEAFSRQRESRPFESQCGDSSARIGSGLCVTDAVPYQPIALDMEREKLLLTQTKSGIILLIDATSLAIRAEIAVGNDPVSIAVDGRGRAYVVNRGSNNLSILDLDLEKKEKDVPVGTSPISVFVDRERPDGPLVYVLNLGSNNLSVYDPTTDKVDVAVVDDCFRPAEMFVDPVERRALLFCKGSVRFTPADHGNRDDVFLPPKVVTFKLL